MKRLWTVMEFELLSYMKNKGFVITSVLIMLLAGGLTFLPRVIDMSDILGIEAESMETEEVETKKAEGAGTDRAETENAAEGVKTEDAGDGEDVSSDMLRLGLVDEKGYLPDKQELEKFFEDAEFVYLDSEKELKEAVEQDKADAGFLVVDDINYRYYVMNKEMSDDNQLRFEQLLSEVHKQRYCEANGIDYESFVAEYEAPVQCEETVLGKDASNNFWYCYVLVIGIFMLIVLYGVTIATSITTEKSNRSMEVLITSIDAEYLLFGKVFAGVVAVIVQVSLILGAALAGYAVNRSYWGGVLDPLLDIPGEVLAAFAVFGVGGFVFYAFLYGAMGALVSKTEDMSKVTGPLQMVIMLVYVGSLLQLENPDGVMMKIFSYLPVSSYSAMFVRIGMGKVEIWEVLLSGGILLVSIFAAGWLAAKIYRMGTLRYGNPVKLSRALKELKM